jgi:hypothetical protein
MIPIRQERINILVYSPKVFYTLYPFNNIQRNILLLRFFFYIQIIITYKYELLITSHSFATLAFHCISTKSNSNNQPAKAHDQVITSHEQRNTTNQQYGNHQPIHFLNSLIAHQITLSSTKQPPSHIKHVFSSTPAPNKPKTIYRVSAYPESQPPHLILIPAFSV